MESTKEIVVEAKKSELNAKTIYDYKQLEYRQEGFLECTVAENKEDIILTYQIYDYKELQQMKKKRKESRLLVLIDIAKLELMADKYQFTLHPDNLFYDRNHRIYLMKRDICKGEEQKITFLKEYKALAGYLLAEKYQYEDYFEGGMDLLKKDAFLAQIYQAESVEEIVQYLKIEYDRLVEINKQTKREVNKKTYQIRNIYIVVCSLLLVAIASLGTYWYVTRYTIEKAMLEADKAYIKNDVISIIDAMEQIEVENIDALHKYTLARAYIHCENLNAEQKENILSTVYINGDEKIMEYWIHIGRMEIAEAENIAMQGSMDELLLYAYLKELDWLEADRTLEGQEKADRIDDLEGKIKQLTDKLYGEE